MRIMPDWLQRTIQGQVQLLKKLQGPAIRQKINDYFRPRFSSARPEQQQQVEGSGRATDTPKAPAAEAGESPARARVLRAIENNVHRENWTSSNQHSREGQENAVQRNI